MASGARGTLARSGKALPAIKPEKPFAGDALGAPRSTQRSGSDGQIETTSETAANADGAFPGASTTQRAARWGARCESARTRESQATWQCEGLEIANSQYFVFPYAGRRLHFRNIADALAD